MHIWVSTKNAVRLAQYKVTTVKTIATCWLFILQTIKAIQLVKHQVGAVLLECRWLRRVFFQMIYRLGTFLLFGRYVWTLNFFFFLHDKFLFFTYLAIFFFNSTYIWVFNFRQIFEGKSYTQPTFKSTYIQKYMVIYLLYDFYSYTLVTIQAC